MFVCSVDSARLWRASWRANCLPSLSRLPRSD